MATKLPRAQAKYSRKDSTATLTAPDRKTVAQIKVCYDGDVLLEITRNGQVERHDFVADTKLYLIQFDFPSEGDFLEMAYLTPAQALEVDLRLRKLVANGDIGNLLVSPASIDSSYQELFHSIAEVEAEFSDNV